VTLDAGHAEPANPATLGLVPESEDIAFTVRFPGTGVSHVLASDWKPGDPVWTGTVDGRRVIVQVRPVLNGFDLSHQGIQVRAFVYTEREANAARLMPAKKVADSGKALRCPMPGLVVSIAVVEGQEVKAGETLAVVEAMKMENVLRAERDLTVSKLNAKPGDSLAVDAVIMEFT
jgi:propionyl-CoA carboxylase alpha chain